MQALGWKTARRLRRMPPGAELLPALRLARRLPRRPAIALRQRAGARQHPEGRHLFGRAADVGRADQPARTARDRRRGREIRRADGQGHRRPAHRPARHQEGGPAGGLGRSQRRRAGLGPCLRQGAAHREDLRRHRMVPLRHAGFDRARRQARADDAGARGRRTRSSSRSRAARATAPRRRSRISAWSASIAATSSTSAAMAGSRSASPILCARSPPRTRCSSMSAPSCSSTARRRAISSAPRRGSTRVGIDYVQRRIVEDAKAGARCTGRFLYSQSFMQKDPGRSAPPAPQRTNTARLAEVRVSRCRRDTATGSTIGPARRHPAGAARGVSCGRTAQPVAVFRTARRRGLRADRPLPASRRPAVARASCMATPSPARCTTGSSRWRPARREAPTRAASRTVAVRVDGDRILLRCRPARQTTRRAGRRHDATRTGPHAPAPIAASAAASDRRARTARSRGDPGASGQSRAAVLEGRGARRDARRLDGRLLYPEIGGSRASWDEALDLVAGVFADTIDAHGPDAVAFYVSGQLLTEDYYVANKLMKGFIGTANIDTNSRLCMASSVAGHIRAFGEDVVPGVYEDLEQADLVVLVGSERRLVPSGAVPAPRRGASRRAARKHRRDRPAPHRDLRHRRPASGAPPRLPTSRCSTALLRPSGRERRLRPRLHRRAHDRGFAAALEAARASVPSLAEAPRIADVDPGDLAPILRLVRRHRAHGHALFARA